MTPMRPADPLRPRITGSSTSSVPPAVKTRPSCTCAPGLLISSPADDKAWPLAVAATHWAAALACLARDPTPTARLFGGNSVRPSAHSSGVL